MQTVDGVQHEERDLNTVLVIDDDADLRDSLRDVLRNEGYAVTVASNGQEALELLPGLKRPCGIVLDIAMPVMNGIHFYQVLSGSPASAGIPVMVLTCDPSLAPTGLPRVKKTDVKRFLSMVAALFEGKAPSTSVVATGLKPAPG